MRKTYSEKIKNDAVQSYLSGQTVSSISKFYVISRSTIYKWIKTTEEKSNKSKAIDIKQYRSMENRCKRLESMVEILKASPCTVSAPLHERYKVIEQLSEKYTVNLLCATLNVAKGSYYNHILRNVNGNTKAFQFQQEITPIIEDIYKSSKQTYGAGRIQAVLKERGIKISESTVSKIMHKNGWFSIRGGAKALYLASQKRVKNLLNQQFSATAPNQIWVCDITYFSFHKRTYYICAILDLFARKVVAYRISTKNSTQLTKATLKEAYNSRLPESGLIFHSDRGSNFTSKTFSEYLKQLNIEQSFSERANPYDNSVMESFFKTLKAEELYRTNYHSDKELKKAIADFMFFYNDKRPHSINNYRTPNAVEADYYAKRKEK